ncbi:MAG: glycosyltransferase family 4 protein [Pseudomonadota bacterium]|nr:glycosyltransferase family 4 protein [Pseudomonadota bacterium]
MEWLFPAFISSIAASIAITKLVLNELKRRSILDLPNRRSSHQQPTPRGGGIAVMAVIAICWSVPALNSPIAAALLVGALLLAIVSWIDDLKTVKIIVRLSAQFAAVILGLFFLDNEGYLLQGLAPKWLDRVLAAFVWVWFINLFNFMDGIDGIASIETMIISFGLTILSVTSPSIAPEPWLSLSILGVATGFLKSNWPPAKLFLGDVGSIPLGYILGGLLLLVAMRGAWQVALILPLYFLLDSTITLCRRLLRLEPIWHAHKEHFYQQAVSTGKSHAEVTTAVAILGLILVGLAHLSFGQPFLSITAAITLTVSLMMWMVK